MQLWLAFRHSNHAAVLHWNLHSSPLLAIADFCKILLIKSEMKGRRVRFLGAAAAVVCTYAKVSWKDGILEKKSFNLFFQCLIPTIPYRKWSNTWTRKRSWWPAKTWAATALKSRPISPKSRLPTVFKTLFSTCNFPTIPTRKPVCGCSVKPAKNPSLTRKNNGPNTFAYRKMSKKRATISFGNFIAVPTLTCLPNSDSSIIIESASLAATTAFTQKVTWIEGWFIIERRWLETSKKYCPKCPSGAN